MLMIGSSQYVQETKTKLIDHHNLPKVLIYRHEK